MNFHTFVPILFLNLNLIPSLFLFFMAARNQLKATKSMFLAICTGLICISTVCEFLICGLFGVNPHTLFLFVLPIYYLILYKMTKMSPAKAAALFVWICSFMSILSNVSAGIDALFHPYSGVNSYNMTMLVARLALSALSALFLFVPFKRNICFLMDNLHLDNVWILTTPIFGVLLMINLLLRPLKYQTLYTNNVFLAFWTGMAAMLFFSVHLGKLFYSIVSGILEFSKIEERNKVLESRESQYISQQHFIESSAKVRHDFKHTIRTLDEMANRNNMEGIREYLSAYIESMPQNDFHKFCKNPSINAILNYYYNMGTNYDITLDWFIELPDENPVSDIDMCNILGNILENAIDACKELRSDRFIELSITTRHDQYLYIVETNRFNGKTSQLDGKYLTSKLHGHGIGLKSVISTITEYGGDAQFHNSSTEFHSNIMVPLHK